MASATYRINGTFDGEPLKKMKTALQSLSEKAKGIGTKIAGAFSGIKGALAATAIEIVKNSKAFQNISSKVADLTGSIKNAMSMALSKMAEPITQKFDAVFDKVRNKIINVFYNFPEVAEAAFVAVKKILNKTFTADGLKNLFAFAFKSLFVTAKAQIENAADFLTTSFGNAITILESIFGKPFITIENAIAKAGNFLIEVINKALDVVWRNAPGWLKTLFDLLGASDSAPKISFEFKIKDPDSDAGTLKGAIEKSLANMKEFAARAQKRQLDAGKELAGAFKDFGAGYETETSEFLAKMQEIMGRELPAELLAVAESAASANVPRTAPAVDWKKDFADLINGASEELSGKYGEFSQKTQNKLAKIGKAYQDGTIDIVTAVDEVNDTMENAHFDAIGSALSDSLANLGGEMGKTVQTIAQGAASGGPWGAILAVIVQVFEKIASKISEVSPSFEKFTNFIDTIADGAMKIIDMDLIESFVQPLVEIFGSIGTIFGSITNVVFELLNVLSPLLDIISKIISAISGIIQCVSVILRVFIKTLAPVLKTLEPGLLVICKVLEFVATILKYVAKMIIKVYAFVANAIARCVNAVIDLLNKLPFVDIDKVGYIDADKMFDDMFQENNFEQENSQTSQSEYKSSSANYTAARDIYMNVYYQNSYINGDARAIALSIRDEIRRAEKLGY